MVSFRPRTRPLDWAAVGAAREVEAVAQSPSAAAVQDIQGLVNNVAFGDARDPPSPELLQKAFGFAQLTIEYLLHVQETVTKSLEAAQAELATERLALDAARTKLSRRQGQGRELRDCQTTLAAASTMLAQFGVDVAPLLQRASTHGGKQSSQMQVWVPAFLDPYSGKSFKSAEYLKRHMYGQHADEVISDLERFGEPSKASSYKREAKEEMPQAPLPNPAPPADSSPPAVPLPMDDIEALAQRVVVEITGGGAHGRVTRRALLKEMQSWRKVQSAGGAALHESISAFLPPTNSPGQGQATTVHDYLESAAVDPYHRSNSSVMLDWRGVDAHLRTLREVDAFLRTDLQKAMADRLAATAQEVSFNFEMKQTKDVDARAKELFRELDTDQSGTITIDELLAAVGDPIKGRGVRSSLGFRDSTSGDITGGGGGSVGAEDEARMLATIKSKMGEMDHDGDGLISLAELKSFLERVSFFNHGFALGKDLGFGIGHASGALVAENEFAAAVDQAKQQAQREAREAAASHYVAVTSAANSEASAVEASLVRASSGVNDDEDDEAEVTTAVSCFEAIQLFMHLDAGVGKGVVLLSDLVREACHSRDLHTRNAFGLDTVTESEHGSSSLEEEEESRGAAVQRVECAEAALMAFASRSAKLNPRGTSAQQQDEEEEVSLEALGACVERLRAFSLGYRHGAYDQARLLLDSSSNDGDDVAHYSGNNKVNAEVINSEEEGDDDSNRSSVELLTQAAPSAVPPPHMTSHDFWVELSVTSAQGLRDDADSNGLADPLYVVRHVSSGTEMVRSKAVHKTLNPRFPPGNTVNIPLNPPGSNRRAGGGGAAAAAGDGNNGQGKEEEDVDEDAPVIVVELWDQDGVIFKKSTDFLGCVALTRRDLLDPRHLGAGPCTFPLTAALAGQPGSSNSNNSSGGNSGGGGDGAPDIVGVLELTWNALAAVRVELLGADGLVEVRRKDLFGSYGSPAAPQASLTLRCEGCDVMKPPAHSSRAKAAGAVESNTSGGGGGGKAGAGVYETEKAPAGSSPRWASSYARVVVPLGSQGWRGGVVEAKDALSGQSLGQCTLKPQDLLQSTPLEGKVHALKSAPSVHDDENEGGHSSSSSSSSGGSGDPDALRISGSSVLVRIVAPVGVASFHDICSKRATDAAAAPAPWLACMEVELQVLRCEGLAKPVEPFVVVLLDGIAVGPTPPSSGHGSSSSGSGSGGGARRSKARPTTRAPEWGPEDDATFVVSVPFPRALAALAALSDNGHGNEKVLAAAAATEPPSTLVTIQVWDANKLTKHELLGAVTLPWSTLIHRSLGTYPLTDYTPAISTNSSSLRLLSKGVKSTSVSFDLASPNSKSSSSSDINGNNNTKKKAYAAAQGYVTVKIQPMQMFDVLLVGCRGVAVADGCGTSDPYAQVALLQGGLAGDATTLAAFEHLSAQSMRTAVQKRTLRPQFGHHFVFSRALSAPSQASDKGERLRRKNLLLTVDEPTSSSLPPGGDRHDVNTYRLSQRYPGVWAETTGGGANRHCNAAHTTLAPFAIRSDRLGGSAGTVNNSSNRHHVSGKSAWRREVLGGLSLQISLWDRDELSSNDFLGACVLSEEQLREPRAGVLSLPLHAADSANNKTTHHHLSSSQSSLSGWVEVLVRASVPPEVVECPRFLRRFPPPTPARLPLVCVRLSNLRCEHLNSADSNGKSDPYATFTARGALAGSNCSTTGSSGRSSASHHHHSVVSAVRGSVSTSAVREVIALGTTETLSRNLSPQWTSAFEVMLPLDHNEEGANLVEEVNDSSSSSRERSASDEGGGSGSAGDKGHAWNNAANSHVEVTIFDKDTFSGDDYLGSCVLNFDDLVCSSSRHQQQQQQLATSSHQDNASRELSKELGSGAGTSVGAQKARQPPSSSGSAFDCFSCKSSDVLLPPPEAGHFFVTSSPAAYLEFTILGASGLAAANLDGQSDPYAKVKCSAALLGAAASTSLTKDGYLKEPAGWSGHNSGKAFKTAVRSSTLAPQWGDALSVCVDLAAILGDSPPSSSSHHDLSSSNGSGGAQLAVASSQQGMGKAFCGITIDVWDAPAVAGHTFLGQVQLDRQQLLRFLTQPTAAPHVFPLVDDSSRAASSSYFKKPAKGVMEVHVMASALPPGWSKCFTSGSSGSLVETPPTRRLSAAPFVNTQPQQQYPIANEDEPPTVPFLVEEAARVEMLIRETARQNIEARQHATGTSSQSSAEAPAN